MINVGEEAGGGGGTAADGTLFTVFLHTLNNKCDGDETTQCDGDADCAVANGGPGGPCGFAGAYGGSGTRCGRAGDHSGSFPGLLCYWW